MATNLVHGETRVWQGLEIRIALSPEGEVMGTAIVQGDLARTVALVRAAARQWLEPWTLYEIREAIPEDFGRLRRVALYQCAWLPADEIAYVPGHGAPMGGGYVLHCRERVPDGEGPMADQLPPLNALVLARYVQARIDVMVQRLVPRYWSGQEVTPMELYGMLGAIAELKGLVADAERSQRTEEGEGKVVSGPEYGRRRHG